LPDLRRAAGVDITAAFTNATMTARFGAISGMPIAGSPAEFGRLISDETEKWSKVVKFAGIKVE
jgi:hypothetical protein